MKTIFGDGYILIKKDAKSDGCDDPVVYMDPTGIRVVDHSCKFLPYDVCALAFLYEETFLPGEYCENCNTFVTGFEYKGCCSGRECGCMGKPIEPCICSQECYEAMFLNQETGVFEDKTTDE